MDKYLLEILKEVNTIIIPGLGALTITDSDSGDIMFMPYLKHDDGELSKYIANKEGMEVNEATNLIAKYVREILNTLDKGESYDMFQFGSFAKDASGDIEFRSWESGASEETPTPFEPSAAEAPDEMPEVIEETVEKVEETKASEAEVENIYIPPVDTTENVEEPQAETEPIEAPLIEPEPQGNEPEARELNILEKEERAATQTKLDKLREEQNKPKKKKRGAAFYLLIFIGVIVIAFSSYVIIDFEGVSKMMPFLASAETEETTDHSAIEEMKEMMGEKEEANIKESEDLTTDTPTSEASESEEIIEEPVFEEPIVKEPIKAPEEVPVPTNSKTGYHIIVGSFGNPENAERFAAKLRSEEGNTSVIQENGLHKVSLGGYNTRDEAKSALSSMNLTISAIIHKVD